MLVFRCSRCTKINISIEGQHCQHCGNEETRVSLVPDNHTEISSSVNNNDAFLCSQNKSAGTDFGVYAQADDTYDVAKLQEGDKNENYSKTLDVNGLQISSSPREPVITIAQNSILKEVSILQDPTPCSNANSGARLSTKRRKLTSGQSSRHKSKNIPKEKKTLKQGKSTKSSRKLNCRSSRPYLQGKSVEDSFDREGINANQMENNPSKLDSSTLLSKKIHPTLYNNIKDDLTTAEESSKDVSRKGCINSILREKLPIKRMKTPILKKLFLCTECEKTFFDESKLKEHNAYHFRKKSFKCDRCDKGFFSEIHLKRHYNSHMDKGPFKCEFCDLVFNRNCHLSRHRKKHILEPSVDGNGDQEKVDNFQQRQRETCDDADPQKHIQTRTVEKMVQQEEQETRVDPHEHFQSWTEEKTLQPAEQETCNDPQKQFQTSAEGKMLQQGEQETRADPHEHFQSRPEEKILQPGEQETCDDPQKQFQTSAEGKMLQQGMQETSDDSHEHFQSWAEEKMLQQGEQEICDDEDPQKQFQTSAGQITFLCNECSAKFIHESDFNAHSLRHSAQTPFKCNECNKRFRYEFELKRHNRVHSLERPFICKICGFSFTQISNLYKHLKIHD